MVHATVMELVEFMVLFQLILAIPIFWVLYTTERNRKDNLNEKSRKIKDWYHRANAKMEGFDEGYKRGYEDAINGKPFNKYAHPEIKHDPF